jgi:hypothetical protein
MGVNIFPRQDDYLEALNLHCLHSRCLACFWSDVLVEVKIEHEPCDHVHDGPVRTGLFSFPILQCFSSASFHDETIPASLFEMIAIGENFGAKFTGGWGEFSMASTSSAEIECLAKYCPAKILPLRILASCCLRSSTPYLSRCLVSAVHLFISFFSSHTHAGCRNMSIQRPFGSYSVPGVCPLRFESETRSSAILFSTSSIIDRSRTAEL